MSDKSNLKIYVVDDSDFSRKGIIEVLESNQYNVVGEASNAEQALQSAQSSGCNLILIDVVMPETSGLELAKIVSEQFTGTQMILMSSLNTESILIDSISQGAIDFLKKPFTPERLLEAMENAIKKQEDLL